MLIVITNARSATLQSKN